VLRFVERCQRSQEQPFRGENDPAAGAAPVPPAFPHARSMSMGTPPRRLGTAASLGEARRCVPAYVVAINCGQSGARLSGSSPQRCLVR
jgi:hypothetical protein